MLKSGGTVFRVCSCLPQDARVVVKACEGLMLLVSLPEPAAAKTLTESTELCELLTARLATFYQALPQSMDPLDIETVESVNWGWVTLSSTSVTVLAPTF